MTQQTPNSLLDAFTAESFLKELIYLAIAIPENDEVYKAKAKEFLARWRAYYSNFCEHVKREVKKAAKDKKADVFSKETGAFSQNFSIMKWAIGAHELDKYAATIKPDLETVEQMRDKFRHVHLTVMSEEASDEVTGFIKHLEPALDKFVESIGELK